MPMQTDVLTKYMTATGASGTGTPRQRVKAVYYVASAVAGTIVFNDGGASGNALITLATPALATFSQMVFFPGEGVLFQADPYVTLTNVTAVTFFYG